MNEPSASTFPEVHPKALGYRWTGGALLALWMAVLTLLNGFLLGILRWNSLKEENKKPCNSKRIFVSFVKKRNPTVTPHRCLYLLNYTWRISLFWLLPVARSLQQKGIQGIHCPNKATVGDTGEWEKRAQTHDGMSQRTSRLHIIINPQASGIA